MNARPGEGSEGGEEEAGVAGLERRQKEDREHMVLDPVGELRLWTHTAHRRRPTHTERGERHKTRSEMVRVRVLPVSNTQKIAESNSVCAELKSKRGQQRAHNRRREGKGSETQQ